jgi:hypothetical protein
MKAVWIGILAFIICAFAPSPEASALEASSCQPYNYSYGGVSFPNASHGIRAQITISSPPHVENGHLAAWIGIGGEGMGESGSDEWLQAGLASQKTETGGLIHYLYIETATGGAAAKETFIQNAEIGKSYLISILEVKNRPGWWRVWLNGEPISEPYHLSFSQYLSPSPPPQVFAESWIETPQACNHFNYKFTHIAMAYQPGGAWKAASLASSQRVDGHFRLKLSGNSFRAYG